MTLSVERNASVDRPLRADAERNRQRILAAAARVFARRGLEAGLDEIAREAGVGTATVYRRFPDKADLIEALFDDRLAAIGALADAANQAPDPWLALVDFLEKSVAMHLADRGLKEVIFGEKLPAAVTRRFRQHRDITTAALTTLIERAKAQGTLREDVELTDLAILTVTLDAAGNFLAPVAPEGWRRVLRLVLDGLRAGGCAQPLPMEPVPLADFESLCGFHAEQHEALAGRSGAPLSVRHR